MTNEEILQRWVASQRNPPFDVSTLMNLDRADERQTVKAEFSEKVPPVGSGPWAIMQHWAGQTIKSPTGQIWKPDEEPTQVPRLEFIVNCGWSIVPDAPKAAEFQDGIVLWNLNGMTAYIHRGGKWYQR